MARARVAISEWSDILVPSSATAADTLYDFIRSGKVTSLNLGLDNSGGIQAISTHLRTEKCADRTCHRDFGLYIHFPIVRVCPYCDFNVYAGPFDGENRDSVIRE